MRCARALLASQRCRGGAQWRQCQTARVETKRGAAIDSRSTLFRSRRSPPLLSPPQVNASPRDATAWPARLKEELTALIAYVQANKAADADWFTVSPTDKTGAAWRGKCWYVHNLIRHEFDCEFELPATYPATAPEIRIPALDGKTAKMYRGGAICLTIHFKPLWAKNAPHFGVAHALCLGLAPWLAAEVPHLVESGVVGVKG